MTNPNWQKCPHCPETWDSSGRYTSPANAERDRIWWRDEHLSGACITATNDTTQRQEPSVVNYALEEVQKALGFSIDHSTLTDELASIGITTSIDSTHVQKDGSIYVAGGENDTAFTATLRLTELTIGWRTWKLDTEHTETTKEATDAIDQDRPHSDSRVV